VHFPQVLAGFKTATTRVSGRDKCVMFPNLFKRFSKPLQSLNILDNHLPKSYQWVA